MDEVDQALDVGFADVRRGVGWGVGRVGLYGQPGDHAAGGSMGGRAQWRVEFQLFTEFLSCCAREMVIAETARKNLGI